MKNKFGKFYIMIVSIRKIKLFEEYLLKEDNDLIKWMDEIDGDKG